MSPQPIIGYILNSSGLGRLYVICNAKAATNMYRMTVCCVLLLLLGACIDDQKSSRKLVKDCSDCPEMVVIPEGSFEMGSPRSEAGHLDTEGPTHRVNVSAFALAKTEVTRQQFSVFVAETGYQVGKSCYTLEGGKWAERQGRGWQDPGYAQQGSHPAVCLNWNDAKAYTEWLSRKTGKRYRLPSDAEWEYAARAGTTMVRYWGENPNQACGYANVGDGTAKTQVAGASNWLTHDCTDGYGYTSPAASFKPNAFGLYDMIGNATEWTEDCWNSNYNGAPSDGSAWAVGNCDWRVLRGGSWTAGPRGSRSATHGRFSLESRNSDTGFRPARSHP